jgi:hypothetical protein
MKADGRKRAEANTATTRALRSVLLATGGQIQIAELYSLRTADWAVRFLGLAKPTVRDLTYRHQLPHVKVGARGVRYRMPDLIAWSEARSNAAMH